MTRILPSFLWFALVLSAACGGDDRSGDSSPEPGTPLATTELPDNRRPGGEVVLASREFNLLDPHQLNGRPDISLTRILWRSLYSLDADYEVTAEANGIASGMPMVSEDGKTVTVELNRGLKWSDGNDLKAEDFVAGIQRSCNPVVAGEYQFVLANISGCDEFYRSNIEEDDLEMLEQQVGVSAPGEYTVEFSLENPQSTFPAILSLWPATPSPVHLERFTAGGARDPGEWGVAPDELVYNGPYMLVEYSQQDHVTLEPNPHWPGAIKPTLDEITIRFMDDFTIATNAYRTGEIDTTPIDITQFALSQADFPDEFVQAEGTPATRGLKLQLDNPTLADLDVRLALAKAIDREQLTEVVVQGAYEPSAAWIPAEVSGVEPGAYEELTGFDPEAARAHLARAGYPNGEGFPTLSLLVIDSAETKALAEFVQEGFRQVLNIELTINIVDPPTRTQLTNAEDYELNYGGWTQDYPDPENWIVGLFETDGQTNDYNCSDPEIDALIAEAAYNQDDEERRRLYQQIERLIIERVCGVIPYFHETRNYLIKPHLLGFRENATGQDMMIPGDWRAEAWGVTGD